MLDDAVEEKDGGEKVRLGMVVSILLLRKLHRVVTNDSIGYSRKFSRHARGFRENRRRSRRQKLNRLLTIFPRHIHENREGSGNNQKFRIWRADMAFFRSLQ